MSVSSRSYLALATALLAGSMTGAAQQQAAQQANQPNSVPQATQPADSSVLHVRTEPPTRTIYLDVVVTSKPGQPVTGLEQKDFTVLDDKTPREITSFEAVDEHKLPVQAILLIDAVNIGYSEISQERIQIDKFLRANGGKLTLPMSLAIFGDQGIKMQGDIAATATRWRTPWRSTRSVCGRLAGRRGSRGPLSTWATR